jgi:hypothetical protein
MNNPIYSDPEWMQKFLHNAAIYFENRPTDGEDTACWANVYNAEKCTRIAAEITRLCAACDAYFKTISLSEMRHGRILVGLERRIARQRRALAKLYQRRHDKNAASPSAPPRGR